eukprot:SAG31_NODE_1254_length_9087_cov_12.553071_10_plen_140_part_00
MSPCRAKIRLLVSDRQQLARMLSSSCVRTAAADGQGLEQQGQTYSGRGSRGRTLQQNERQAGPDRSDGLSMDTLAIVVSVLIGAAGYFVQCAAFRRMLPFVQSLPSEYIDHVFAAAGPTQRGAPRAARLSRHKKDIKPR